MYHFMFDFWLKTDENWELHCMQAFWQTRARIEISQICHATTDIYEFEFIISQHFLIHDNDKFWASSVLVCACIVPALARPSQHSKQICKLTCVLQLAEQRVHEDFIGNREKFDFIYSFITSIERKLGKNWKMQLLDYRLSIQSYTIKNLFSISSFELGFFWGVKLLPTSICCDYLLNLDIQKIYYCNVIALSNQP